MANSKTVQILEPWNLIPYDVALEKQRTGIELKAPGWILFCCPPTITLGKRGHFSDVLLPMVQIKRFGVRLLPVDRGGLVTYHGPGQVLGFPVGSLAQHGQDPRGVRAFVCQVQKTLKEFISAELESQGKLELSEKVSVGEDQAGVWIAESKIVAIGMAFGRSEIRHGFAMNITPLSTQFELVVPCGQIGARPASLFQDTLTPIEFMEVVQRLKLKLS